MNYVNLHWLRILLEQLGILIIKNKPRIFLHLKTVKRWIILLESWNEIWIRQKNVINITVNYLQGTAISWIWEVVSSVF